MATIYLDYVIPNPDTIEPFEPARTHRIRSHLLIAANGEIIEGGDLRTCRRIASLEEGSKVILNRRQWVRPENWGFSGHPRPYAITTVNLPQHLA